MTTGNGVFHLKEGAGWSRGLDNLLDAELGRWFRTKRWWVQILIWAALINLILFVVVISEEVCILMQGAIVGEKQSGTAAWVLSQPVSRPAFVLAKLIGNTVGVAVTIVLAQGLIAYLLIYLDSGSALPLVGFMGGLGVQLIHLLFYLTFTLMLGAAFRRRGPVIAIPLVFLFVQQLLLGILPTLANVLPWTLTVPLDNSAFPSVAAALMTGVEPLSYLPLATTFGVSVLFVSFALWIFGRQEF
jgi:ABC-2 type transport system permease protein